MAIFWSRDLRLAQSYQGVSQHPPPTTTPSSSLLCVSHSSIHPDKYNLLQFFSRTCILSPTHHDNDPSNHDIAQSSQTPPIPHRSPHHRPVASLHNNGCQPYRVFQTFQIQKFSRSIGASPKSRSPLSRHKLCGWRPSSQSYGSWRGFDIQVFAKLAIRLVGWMLPMFISLELQLSFLKYINPSILFPSSKLYVRADRPRLRRSYFT
jgi:hypothetical protein